MKITSCYNYDSKTVKNEVNNGSLQTIENMSLSVKDMLDKFVHGEQINIHDYGSDEEDSSSYYDEAIRTDPLTALDSIKERKTYLNNKLKSIDEKKSENNLQDTQSPLKDDSNNITNGDDGTNAN